MGASKLRPEILFKGVKRLALNLMGLKAIPWLPQMGMGSPPCTSIVGPKQGFWVQLRFRGLRVGKGARSNVVLSVFVFPQNGHPYIATYAQNQYS